EPVPGGQAGMARGGGRVAARSWHGFAGSAGRAAAAAPRGLGRFHGNLPLAGFPPSQRLAKRRRPAAALTLAEPLVYSAGMPPKVIGPYTIISTLGKGGIGTVYRALDSRSDEEVALKLLRTGPALDSVVAKRL